MSTSSRWRALRPSLLRRLRRRRRRLLSRRLRRRLRRISLPGRRVVFRRFLVVLGLGLDRRRLVRVRLVLLVGERRSRLIHVCRRFTMGSGKWEIGIVCCGGLNRQYVALSSIWCIHKLTQQSGFLARTQNRRKLPGPQQPLSTRPRRRQ